MSVTSRDERNHHGAVVRGGLVVDDHERANSPALLVEDHVGPPSHGAFIEVQLEGSLGSPDPPQVIAPISEVVLDESMSGGMETLVRPYAGRWQRAGKSSRRAAL